MSAVTTSSSDVSDALAFQMMEALAGQPPFDLLKPYFKLEIAEHLKGTPTRRLLLSIESEANRAGFYVQRAWLGFRHGGEATYSCWRGSSPVATCVINGKEGKTFECRAYRQLEAFRAVTAAAARDVVQSGMSPTIPVPGNYLMSRQETEQVMDLGAMYSRKTFTWYSSAPNFPKVERFLMQHSCINLGELTWQQHFQVAKIVPPSHCSYVTIFRDGRTQGNCLVVSRYADAVKAVLG